MTMEDTPDDPEAASPTPTPETRVRARPLRGHGPKIARAVAELRAEGLLVPDMRPCHCNKLIIDRTVAHGHKDDPPSPRAIARFFESEAEMAVQSAELAELAE